MTKILMVCLGNICRSPLAKYILEEKLGDIKNNIFVDSCGTAAYHIGESADERTIAIAKKYHIDISKHRARQFKKNDFETFDIIYAMDADNFNQLVYMADNYASKSKIKLFLEDAYPNKKLDVPDPYYGDIESFDNTFKIIDNACEIIVKNFKF